MKPKLSLRRESMTDLDTGDLSQVVGGSLSCGTCFDCQIDRLTDALVIGELPTDVCFTYYGAC